MPDRMNPYNAHIKRPKRALPTELRQYQKPVDPHVIAQRKLAYEMLWGGLRDLVAQRMASWQRNNGN